MNAIDVVNEVKKALLQTKNGGEVSVSIDAMDNFMDQLGKQAEQSKEIDKLQHSKILAEFEAENSRSIAYSQNATAHSLEMFKSVITAGQAALKASMIINGGAAAALLAFTGKIWNEGSSIAVTSALSQSILLFCFGVLAAAFASGTTYISQYCFANKYIKSGSAINGVSIISVFGSFALFCYSSINAASSFTAHFAGL
ncbi:hypothetical protein [uncultured Aliivibrio sp.]|uniref:hypothetical protein n=1 Tax=uncultured Aliivibrio sp. TaxID=873085 RepID=UPI00261C6E0F|nr:hypothetical protein [uncultured Aliivibrio sp.]